MAVVVFGGNGFVGTNVLKALCARQIPRSRSRDRADGRSTSQASRGQQASRGDRRCRRRRDVLRAARRARGLLSGRRLSHRRLRVAEGERRFERRADFRCARRGVARVVINAMMPAWRPRATSMVNAWPRRRPRSSPPRRPRRRRRRRGGFPARSCQTWRGYGRATKGGTPIPLAPARRFRGRHGHAGW